MKSVLFRRRSVSCRQRMYRCGTPHTVLLALLFAAFSFSLRAQDQDARLDELAKKLKDAQQVAASLQKTIEDALAPADLRLPERRFRVLSRAQEQLGSLFQKRSGEKSGRIAYGTRGKRRALAWLGNGRPPTFT